MDLEYQKLLLQVLGKSLETFQDCEVVQWPISRARPPRLLVIQQQERGCEAVQMGGKRLFLSWRSSYLDRSLSFPCPFYFLLVFIISNCFSRKIRKYSEGLLLVWKEEWKKHHLINWGIFCNMKEVSSGVEVLGARHKIILDKWLWIFMRARNSLGPR